MTTERRRNFTRSPITLYSPGGGGHFNPLNQSQEAGGEAWRGRTNPRGRVGLPLSGGATGQWSTGAARPADQWKHGAGGRGRSSRCLQDSAAGAAILRVGQAGGGRRVHGECVQPGRRRPQRRAGQVSAGTARRRGRAGLHGRGRGLGQQWGTGSEGAGPEGGGPPGESRHPRSLPTTPENTGVAPAALRAGGDPALSPFSLSVPRSRGSSFGGI